LNQLDLKKTFKEVCKNHFSESEIFEFWKWFKEHLDLCKTDEQKLKNLNHWLSELITGKPIQYIFGHAYFHQFVFNVNEYTLIPRPETEELCEHILQFNNSNIALKGIDIGTGSGCIPVTLTLKKERWIFDAIDISKNALAVAHSNAIKYEVQNRIDFIERDFFNFSNAHNQYDIIVSNPPYIDKLEILNMDKRVTNFEPHLALFVNQHVLEFYEALFKFFEMNTNPNAQLWMETHQDHCDDVVNLFNSKFHAKKIEDFSQNPRFVFVTK
jgi:release factor glutamine methyltransferase